MNDRMTPIVIAHVDSNKGRNYHRGHSIVLSYRTDESESANSSDDCNAKSDLKSVLANWTSDCALREWIEKQVLLCRPNRLHLCTGSERERATLIRKMVHSGTLIPVAKRPNCYVARSPPEDVARVESRTFICSENCDDAGPLNNWAEPRAMERTLETLFDGAMQGRTMYVLPFCMGPLQSEHAKIGVQLTDSPYVVVNTRIMTRGLGEQALKELERRGTWTPCLHSVGQPMIGSAQSDCAWPCDPANKHIVHFTDAKVPWIASYGSGYGGNALLGKKCLALRIASVLGRKEGWLAEHMLILGLTDPQGKTTYVCAAFPSACGKTNLAMLVPSMPGWKVECIGDDIAWLRVNAQDGRLYAVNPEAGFFGVAPGTSAETNPNAMAALDENCIFTNVAMTSDGDVWWEGMTDSEPSRLTDWLGRDWRRSENGQNGVCGEERRRKAAHPNSRFTAPCKQCPVISEHFDSPTGVPISAIIFGGRRRDTMPLVFEAFNWMHGVYLGATMLSERTAAAEGAVGELRNDPMAMHPFIGYNVGDYWQHWLDVGTGQHRALQDRLDGAKLHMPSVFHVNWFRRDADGKFLWPGFGDNGRVLKWIVQRCDRSPDRFANAERSPIGWVPRRESFDTEGLALDNARFDQLTAVYYDEWTRELQRHKAFLTECGSKVPPAVWKQHELLARRLESHFDDRSASTDQYPNNHLKIN